ncbi:hypothetical protein F5883DRAFT_531355 [Diaporthe sp. PMI_573]|nr:hypothetical protein F5883DRAFT_531355 [Diaporthaceae sp. PMI_573]
MLHCHADRRQPPFSLPLRASRPNLPPHPPLPASRQAHALQSYNSHLLPPKPRPSTPLRPPSDPARDRGPPRLLHPDPDSRKLGHRRQVSSQPFDAATAAGEQHRVQTCQGVVRAASADHSGCEHFRGRRGGGAPQMAPDRGSMAALLIGTVDPGAGLAGYARVSVRRVAKARWRPWWHRYGDRGDGLLDGEHGAVPELVRHAPPASLSELSITCQVLRG